MATYNGEKYICQQIDSILSQTIQDFILIVQDDHSTDDTFYLLQSYEKLYPQKIIVTQSLVNSGNAKYNFIELMIKYKYDYMMLCDQDDVWKPNKIELTLRKIQEMERTYGAQTPLLVHTDLEVVDENLQTISPSFRQAMNADYNRTALHQLIIQNILTGCTALYNKALAEYLTIIPSYMVMHDWWLILVASAFGYIGHINDTTILYRQHKNNSIGAKDVRTLSYKLNRLFHWSEMKQAIAQTYPQAQSFLEVYNDLLSPHHQVFLQEYCKIPTLNKLERIRTIARLNVLKHGIARKIANFLVI